MSSEWIETTVGEFCQFHYGKNLPQPNRVKGNVPVISSAGIIDNHNAAFVNKAGVVIGRKGSVGKVTYSPDPFWPIDTAFFVEDQPQKRDIRFVYYLLQTLGFEEMNSDSAVPGLNRDNAHAIQIKIPFLSEQKKIADFLANLDDRITLLRETNQTLEAIAQAIFKSWFVDFDPVRAKMEGRAPEGMDEETAALFPDAFEESELGLMPKGWYCCSFSETVEVIGGGTPKTSVAEYWGGNIPWFSVVDAPNLSDVFVLETEKNITQTGLNNSSTKLLPIGTTIISARGTVGRLALTGRAMAMNQSCYGLRGKAGDEFFTYFNTARLVEQLKQRAHGSVFDTITQKTFSGISVVYPTKKEILAFDKVVQPLLERIKTNLLHISTLTALRDTLLPRLISGQLSLHDVDLPEFSSTELV